MREIKKERIAEILHRLAAKFVLEEGYTIKKQTPWKIIWYKPIYNFSR